MAIHIIPHSQTGQRLSFQAFAGPRRLGRELLASRLALHAEGRAAMTAHGEGPRRPMRVTPAGTSGATGGRRRTSIGPGHPDAEHIIGALLAMLLNIPPDEADARIDEALPLIVRCFGADHGDIIELGGKDGRTARLFEWPRPTPDRRRALPWIDRRLRRGETVLVGRIADLPDEAFAERAELAATGIGAFACVPIFYEGEPAYCLSLERKAPVDHWTEEQTVTALQVVAQLLQNVLERRRMHRDLRNRSHYDAITGLPNRALFHDLAKHTLGRARRMGKTVAVLWVSVDRFKTIAESLGFASSDVLLRQFADRLQTCVRQADTAGYVGGDEFTLLLDGLNRGEDAILTAERIFAALGTPFRIDGQEIFVTTSIGIATADPAVEIDANTLIARAGSALAWAREEGGNHVKFHAPDMNRSARARLSLETQLRNALEAGEFVLHYQPQVDLDLNRAVGVELLVRWDEPRLGTINPAEFLDVMEETGLIVPLSEWILAEACRAALDWRTRVRPGMTVAVNVSARWLRRGDLPRLIERVTREVGLPPDGLELEIKEDVLLRDAEGGTRAVHQLRDLGIRIALDDFGTGYSSLSYLQRLPIDRLKIDRSFIGNITANRGDAAIVTAMLALGRKLGIAAVAEGVEKRSQLDCLRNQGCRLVQGFLFSRPLARSAADAWLKQPLPAMAELVGPAD